MRAMSKVVITGATGVVGSKALAELLAGGHEVVALGRRALSLQHEKLASKVVDLASVESIAAAIPEGTAHAICGLGTTMKQAGSKPAFRAVDFDAVVNFGKACRQRGVTRFVLVSAIGANAKSSNFYLKTKGEAEEALIALGFEQLTLMRPSFIDDEGTRKDDRLGERLGLPVAKALFSLVGKTNKYAPITGTTLGRGAVKFAFDEAGEKVRFPTGAALFSAGA